MRNDHWAIPFSCGFNIIKVDNFDANRISIDVHMEVFTHIKFTGCPHQEEVMEWCTDNLKCRVNEEEMKVIDPLRRKGSWRL